MYRVIKCILATATILGSVSSFASTTSVNCALDTGASTVVGFDDSAYQETPLLRFAKGTHTQVSVGLIKDTEHPQGNIVILVDEYSQNGDILVRHNSEGADGTPAIYSMVEKPNKKLSPVPSFKIICSKVIK